MDTEDDFVLISHSDCHPPSYLSEIRSIVAELADDLWPVNKKIHDNPELGYEEYIAHDALTSFMRTRPGWKVTPSAYGMKTAWVAVWDSGKKGPVVSFNAEMDCLPGIGHACGHNLIASASVSGALATASLLSRHHLPGKVVLLGTPAEEGGGGKIRLLEAGAYRNIDLNLISHPGIVADTSLMRTSAFSAFRVEFFGVEAHAAANPWLGINALDALVTSYNALSVLRQQTMPGDVIQGNISDGGVRPNIIHAHAAGNFVIRSNSQPRLRELREKVEACFHAGSLATGAKLKITQQGSYMDHVPNRVLGASYTNYWNAMANDAAGPPWDGRIPEDQDVDEIRGRTMASTDQGDVSYAMPSLSAGFAIPAGPKGQGPHNPEFAEAAGTRTAFDVSLKVGVALAGVAVDVFTNEGMLEEVKRAWRKDVGR
ncbi:peptidase M20 (amidohydrolase) [Colletotrichum plurivorum]|uniref:Peptidase M20 domain-containing protein 2 n=1 Tax=Colletotrichum plurivorum TaxID=2175906 RepID=A0A8H6NG56_9PEZI|nr:peptidase M20 (amidohydrolase) [Colletotrichum plurivorum]